MAKTPKRRRRSPSLRVRERVRRTPWTQAAPYVGRWHAVNDWAGDALGLADEVFVTTPNPRVMKRRALWVRDIDDNEEAWERGTGIEALTVPQGPQLAAGGRRRVLIRVYTWTVDEVAGSVYEPMWITLGVGTTARMASDHFARRVREYTFAVKRGIESRRLIATALEVTWWTANETAAYV